MEKLQGITALFANELNDTEQEPDEVERAMVPDADSARSPAMSDGTSLATPARAIRDGGKVASARAHVYDEIDAAVVKLGLSLLAKNYILGALKSPSRRPHGRVTGRYPSPGMGVSFGIEHGPLGVAALTELETDSKWKVCLDFPPALKHETRVDGRKRSFLKAPTFLAVADYGVVLITLVEESSLRRGAEAAGGQYTRDANGQWICPSADAAAAKLGFTHEVWTDRHFNRTRVSNTEVLYDYFCEGPLTPRLTARQDCLAAAIALHPTPTIEELVAQVKPKADITDVFRAIVTARLWVDLDHDDLMRYEPVRIFSSQAALVAFRASEAAIARAAEWVDPTQRPLRTGDTVFWDGVIHRVINIGLQECALDSGGDITTIKIEQLQKLVADGSVVLTKGSQALADARRQDALEVLANSDPRDLETAVLRLNRIEPYLSGLKHAPSERSLRRYIAAFKATEQSCGNGLLGLIPRQRNGNRERRIQETVLKIVADKVNTSYLDTRNKHAHSLYQEIALTCEADGLPPPSYSWLCRYLKKLNQHKLIRARKGTKAAYQVAPRGPYEPASPVHIEASRTWELGYADHTEVDVETIFSDSREPAGRCWLSLLIDHQSRRVLAVYLTYEPPSYRSVLMLIRECITRFNRLPKAIVVDRGKEFRSTWFRTLCAFLKVRLIDRPAAEPRYGSPMERMFGTANTNFFHHLVGNTQLTKNVRQVTKEVNPRNLAIWDLATLDRWTRRFLYEVYDTMDHRGTLVAPRQAFQLSVARFGMSESRFIPADARMILITSPSTAKGFATVSVNGVKINYIWFNCQLLYPLVGQTVRVRYDPLDLGRAWAWVNGSWEPLVSRYQRILAGLSERLLAIATEEYRQRRGEVEFRRLTDTKLVEFLREVETIEAFLLEKKRHAEVLRLLGQQPPGEVAEEARIAQAAAPAANGYEPSPTTGGDLSGNDDDDLDFDVDDIEITALPAY